MLLNGEDLHLLHGFRPVLYPMFLAVWYKLGGAWGVDLALAVQHLLGVATGLIVALLGARLFRHRLSGVMGGLLYLLAPVPLYFEGELLIESSYTFLICFGLLLHLYATENRGCKRASLWLVGGALMVLVAQARANILVFLAVYPLFTAWRWRHERKFSAVLPLLGLVGGFAMMIPWGFVNMNQSGEFHLLPNQGGVNLYLGNKRTADGMVPRQERRTTYGEYYQDSVEIWAREEYENSMRAQSKEPSADPMAISQYWTHRTMEEIKASPGGWLHLIAKKCWLTLWNKEIPNNKNFAFLQDEFTWLRVLPVRWVVLLMLAPAGIWAALRYGNRDHLLILLAYAGLYSAANVAFFICDRYRYPVWPVMAVFAGGGLLFAIEMIRRHERGKIILILGSMALMAAISLPNWFGAQIPNYARDYQFRSIAWYAQGRFPEALVDIDRSVALDPEDSTSFHHQGNVLFALKRYAEAKTAFEETLKLNPAEGGAWNNLGETLEVMGRTNEALEAFRRATELPPLRKNAFFGMAAIQIRQGHLDEAVATLDRLEQQQSAPDAAALAIRSVIERQRGHISEADALEQQARHLDADAAIWGIKRATNP